MILPATRLDGRSQQHISLTTNSFYTTILHSSNTNTAVSCSLRGRQNSALIATVKTSAGSITFNSWLAYDATTSSKQLNHSLFDICCYFFIL